MTKKKTDKRLALSPERIARAAIEIADATGIESLSMRKLADDLDVQAMSLYNHVKNKEDLTRAIIELAISEIDLSFDGLDWEAAMRLRAHSALDVFMRHPWAPALISSNPSPGPASLRYHESILKILREGGFSISQAGNAFSVLDGYIFGFAIQKANLPLKSPEQVAEVAGQLMSFLSPDEFPHLIDMIQTQALKPSYNFADEFDIGLELILAGLAGWIKK